MLLRYLSVRITEQAAVVPVSWRGPPKRCADPPETGKKMQ